MSRNCPECQADISGRHHNAKFCSDSCRDESERRSKATDYLTNREHYQSRNKEWYENNKETVNFQGKQSRAIAMGIDLNNRRCSVCDKDISHRTLKAVYCEPCYEIHERELEQERSRKVYAERPDEIKAQVQAYRQTPRGRAQKMAWDQENKEKLNEQNRQRHRRKVGYDPSGRTCAECSADISHRNWRAKLCESCYKTAHEKQVKECAECGADISKESTKTIFCSEACRTSNRKRTRNEEYADDRREWRESRTCAKCEVSIADLSSGARYCQNCSDVQRKETQLLGVYKRRARKLGQLGTVSPDIVDTLLKLQKNQCWAPWCKAKIDRQARRGVRKLERDHNIPLSKFGLHDDNNLQLLCAPCNREKKATLPELWYVKHGLLPIVSSPIAEGSQSSHD